jgi:alpha-1,2-mannosyltransferase
VLRFLRSARRVEAALAWTCLIVLLIHVGFVIHRRMQRPSDFDIAREFGRRFVAHEYLYRQNLHFPYLPAAAMVFAPLSFLPAWAGFALQYALAIVALGYTLAFLFAMLAPRWPDLDGRSFALGATTALFAAQYVLRDLFNAGPHLLLLFVAVLATRLVASGLPLLAAPAYGLLMAVKPPFAFLLVFLAWKRQCRLFVAATASLAFWLVAPALHMGWDAWWTHHVAWARSAFAFLPFVDHAATVQAPAPGAPAGITAGAILEWNKNQALYATLLRNLPVAPRVVAPLLMLALLAFCAWRTRRRSAGDDPRWLVESSAALLLAVLLSPITWGQHLVFAVPALFLLVAAPRSPRGAAAQRLTVLAVYALLALVLNPEVAGRETSFRLLGYGLHTAAMLLLLGWVLLRPSPEKTLLTETPG